MTIDKTPKPEAPAFIDKLIVQVQDALVANLPWLDHAFGQAQRLVTKKDQVDYFYPGVHIGNGTYINVFPDQTLGNYSFVLMEDPQNIDFRPHTTNNVKVKYSIVFWFNLDKIFGVGKDRNTEQLKADILKVLARKLFLTTGRLDVRAIYEQAENIYRGFSVKEVDSQFLMQPYGGFRFEGEMILMEDC